MLQFFKLLFLAAIITSCSSVQNFNVQANQHYYNEQVEIKILNVQKKHARVAYATGYFTYIDFLFTNKSDNQYIIDYDKIKITDNNNTRVEYLREFKTFDLMKKTIKPNSSFNKKLVYLSPYEQIPKYLKVNGKLIEIKYN